MNTLLSMILSLILAFGGGAMPAVPETATTCTVDSIVLSLDGESVALDPAIVFSTAAGAEQLQAQFGIELADDILVPLAGELTPDGVKFSLGSGRAYSLSADTLNALTGMTEPDAESEAAVNEILQEFGDLAGMISGMYSEALTNYEANFALSEEMYAYWTELSGATPETFEIEVDGVSVPVTCVELNLTPEEMFSAFDLLLEKGSEPMKAYIQQMLDIMNMASGSNYTSFEELFAALPGIDPEASEESLEMAMPIELTYGSKDGLYYMEEAVNTEEAGMTMEVSAVNVYQGGMHEMTMNMVIGDGEYLIMSMDGAGAFDLTGNVNFALGFAAEAGGLPVMDFDLTLDRAVAEDGLAELDTVLNIEVVQSVSYHDAETGEREQTQMETTDISIGWTADESLEDDGSLTTDCGLTVDAAIDEESHSFALDFALNRAELPFADAFAGMENVELPADTEDEVYQMLASEVFGPISDLMTLAVDESVTEAVELFSDLAESMVVDSAESFAFVYDDPVEYPADVNAGIDEEYYVEEYALDEPFISDTSYEYPEYLYDASEGGEPDFAAAEEIYASELPAFTAPEGYELGWMYASEGYCGMDFYRDGDYFSVSLSPTYGYDTEVLMLLNADGSLSPVNGTAAQLQFNEDGSPFYVSFTLNGTSYGFYVDGMTMEEVQNMLAGFVG